MKQELLTLPEQLRSPPVFVGVRFVRSLAFCVVFGRSLFVLCLVSLCRCVVCPSSVSVCGFWFPFWYLHICLKKWWWKISPINKANNYLSSQINEHEKENSIWRWQSKPWILNRYKNVAELNSSMGSKPFFLDSWICIDNTGISKQTKNWTDSLSLQNTTHYHNKEWHYKHRQYNSM